MELDASAVIAEGPFDAVMGLPVHVLVVHAVVVLLPAVSIAAIVVALRTRSRRLMPWVTVAAAASTALAWIAAQSGEVLAGRVSVSQEHLTWGERLPIASAVLTVALALLWSTSRGRRRGGGAWLLAWITVAAALGVLAVTVMAGHSGADGVWGSVIENTEPGSVPLPK
jgi:hypothetical protein